jgi:hypothetical protein
VPHQQAEHVEACALRERGQCRNSRILFHISSLADIEQQATLRFSAKLGRNAFRLGTG